MKNNATRTIRSEEITIDVRICAALAANRGGEVYLAAIAPDMELTVITLDEAPGILPCFDEDDAGHGISKEEPLGFRYNPKQVIKLMGKRYLTGPVIFHRFTDDGKFAPLTMSDMFAIQKYLETASVTLMIDEDALTCICID